LERIDIIFPGSANYSLAEKKFTSPGRKVLPRYLPDRGLGRLVA
jgi:hypothetical protein